MKILIEAVDFLLNSIEGKEAVFVNGHYHLSSKDVAKKDFYRQALKDRRFWILLSNAKGMQVLKCFEFDSWEQIDELELMARTFDAKDCLITIGNRWYDVYLGYYTDQSQLSATEKMATTCTLKDLFVYF